MGVSSADGPLRDFENAPFCHGDTQRHGDLLGGGIATNLLHQEAAGAGGLVDRLERMDGQSDGPALVGDGARDGLANPPRRIGGELESAAVLELLDGASGRCCLPG